MTRPPPAPGVRDGLAALGAGRMSAQDWIDACHARIAACEAQTRAWAHLPAPEALPGARPGALHGLPVGVKDVIDVAGMPTRCNSPIEARTGPVRADAAAVRRLRAAGAVMLGKTVTTEYAFARPGPTRNPLDPARTPGGSSSGSAAAVAEGHVPVALATQTGGSTIRPAAFCGIVGYKPPFGTVPLGGLRVLDPAMDTIGLHARSLRDLAPVASVLEARPRRAEPAKAPPRFVALGLGAMGPGADGALDVPGRVAPLLRAAGASVTRAALPAPFRGIDAAHRTLMSAAVARSFARIHARHAAHLSDSLRAFIERGQRETTAALARARACVAEAHAALARLAPAGSLLLWPAAPGEAPVGLESTGDSLLNRPWSLLGYGVVTLPAGLGPAGMPLGLQIIDPAPGAPHLFAAAAFAEAVLAAGKDRT